MWKYLLWQNFLTSQEQKEISSIWLRAFIKKSIANITRNGERLNAFLLGSREGQKMFDPNTSIQHGTEALQHSKDTRKI